MGFGCPGSQEDQLVRTFIKTCAAPCMLGAIVKEFVTVNPGMLKNFIGGPFIDCLIY